MPTVTLPLALRPAGRESTHGGAAGQTFDARLVSLLPAGGDADAQGAGRDGRPARGRRLGRPRSWTCRSGSRRPPRARARRRRAGAGTRATAAGASRGHRPAERRPGRRGRARRRRGGRRGGAVGRYGRAVGRRDARAGDLRRGGLRRGRLGRPRLRRGRGRARRSPRSAPRACRTPAPPRRSARWPTAWRAAGSFAMARPITSSRSPAAPGAASDRPRRRLRHVRVQDRRLGRPRERNRPGEALVEHAGERVDVARGARALAVDLLGRDVVERARRSGRSWSGSSPSVPLVSPKSARNEWSRRPTSTFWGLMSRWIRPIPCASSSASATGREDLQRPGDVELAGVDQVLQRLPAHEPHRDEQALLGLARLVDGDDVRMLQARLDLALAPEALRGTPMSSLRCAASSLRATTRSSESCVAS